MFRKVLKVSALGLFIFIASGSYLVTMIPSGPTIQVKAEVVSRTSKSGPTGNTGVLICMLENGVKLSVDIPPIATVQTGDIVYLNTHERYFIGPKYSFAGKLLTD